MAREWLPLGMGQAKANCRRWEFYPSLERSHCFAWKTSTSMYDNFLPELRSQVMNSVFISYAREDRQVATGIAERLRFFGISVFLDHEALVVGMAYDPRIEKELEAARAVFVLLSSNSRRSSYVSEELQGVLDSGKLVVPILLDRGAMENWLWPLVAKKRDVIYLYEPEGDDQLDRLIRELAKGWDVRETTLPAPNMSTPQVSTEDHLPAPERRSLWVTILIALLSALIGGLVALHFR